MQILCYRGKSFISKMIKWQTRSVYSHVAIRLGNGAIIEAWHKGGVTLSPREKQFELHTKGTTVDVFELHTDYKEHFNARACAIFLRNQIGKSYDFRSVFRFMSRKSASENSRWFCSELACAAFEAGGQSLLKIKASEASPRDVSMSTKLVFSHKEATE